MSDLVDISTVVGFVAGAACVAAINYVKDRHKAQIDRRLKVGGEIVDECAKLQQAVGDMGVALALTGGDPDEPHRRLKDGIQRLRSLNSRWQADGGKASDIDELCGTYDQISSDLSGLIAVVTEHDAESRAFDVTTVVTRCNSSAGDGVARAIALTRGK